MALKKTSKEVSTQLEIFTRLSYFNAASLNFTFSTVNIKLTQKRISLLM